MNYEQKLVHDLQKNEQIVQIVKTDDLIKEWATKDNIKTASGYVSPVMDALLAKKILKELGSDVDKVVIKQYAGKSYVIFKGYAGNRKILKGTRYLANNPKVVRMAIGPKGITSSVKSGFVISIVLSVGIEIFNYFIQDTATLSKLLGTVTSDIMKIGFSSIAAAVAGLTIGTATVLGTAAATPLIVAIAVGVVTSIALEKIDGKIGATRALIAAYEQMGINLTAINQEINRNIYYLEKNPQMIRCLFGYCGATGY
jgi:hypothetical protein